MKKKQLEVDGRLSEAHKLTFMEVKLMLSLLLRYFTQLDKSLSKKGPKPADSKLIAKLQKDLKGDNLSPIKLDGYINKLTKLKDAQANQVDTKELSAGNKKVIEHLKAILELYGQQASGYRAVGKKTAKVVIRKKRRNAAVTSAERSSRLDNIVLVIGQMEAVGCQQITATSISDMMQKKKMEVDQNSNAHVRACLREHRNACEKEGKNCLVNYNPSAGNHEYFLTEEGKKHYLALTAV